MTRAHLHPVDLLCNGHVVASPSIITPNVARREGWIAGAYKWLDGHSPYELPFAELAPLPAAMLEWWRTAVIPATPHQECGGTSVLLEALGGPIGEGGRHDTLLRAYGSFAAKYTPEEADALLRLINEARCKPPLDDKELQGILDGIDKREGRKAKPQPFGVAPW